MECAFMDDWSNVFSARFVTASGRLGWRNGNRWVGDVIEVHLGAKENMCMCFLSN